MTPTAPAGGRGSDLVVRDLAAGTDMVLGNVAEYGFDKKGNWLVMVIDAQGQIGNGVHIREMKTGLVTPVETGKATYRDLTWNRDGNAFTLLKGVEDRTLENPWYSVLGFCDLGLKPTKVAFDPKDDKAFPAGMGVSMNRGAQWTDDLAAITFGLSEAKKKGSEAAPPRRRRRWAAAAAADRAAVVQGRQPELTGASVPLLHLHAANPERGVLRRLAFDACNGKVLGVNPNPAANRKFGRLLGINLQNIAGPAIRVLRSNQAKFVIFRDDAAFLTLTLLAGFRFRLDHLADDVAADESGAGFRDHLKRLHPILAARHVHRHLGRLAGLLIFEPVMPDA